MSVLELKGNLFTLMVLHLFSCDKEKITQQLAEKIAKAPLLFQHAPIAIDLSALKQQGELDLAHVVDLLRYYQLVPIGVRGGSEEYNENVLRVGLGILPNHATSRHRSKTETEETIIPTLQDKVMTQPIRSGQQVFSPQGDLVVLSSVSSGAEVLAHRHIHVYGALRGRALAGVRGDQQARIFCQLLDAELISIAGHYQINEDLKDEVRGKPAQIFLENNKLIIQALDAYPR